MARVSKAKEIADMIDTTEEVSMSEIPLGKEEQVKEEAVKSQQGQEDDEGLVNCLRNERVIVRFVPRPYMHIQDPHHVLYGGLSENATVTYVVPKLSTGIYKNVLTDKEKAYLERVMGLEYNAMSIYRKQNNFWDSSNDEGINKVTLHKQDNYLDLSNPEDYIKYKILLANKNEICPNLHELEERPRATYRFVIVSEDSESKRNSVNMSITMQCYKEYGKVEDNVDILRTLVEILSGRPVSPRVKTDALQSKINEFIQANPKKFLSIITDELLPTKALIKRAVEAGLIGRKNDLYFLREDNSPLCEMNEESTLNNAAKFLNSPKRQELLFMLQAKIKG